MMFWPSLVLGAENGDIRVKGDYNREDSISLSRALDRAKKGVEMMYLDMLKIRSSNPKDRIQAWQENARFRFWLGQSHKMDKAFRVISKIHTKLQRNKVVFLVKKKNKGRCKGWISAWTIPWGPVKIRLCEDFFLYRTHLQEKVIVHEMGHEVGLLSHHKIHGCNSARKAARFSKKNTAKKSVENYAWLAMSYLNVNCDY